MAVAASTFLLIAFAVLWIWSYSRVWRIQAVRPIGTVVDSSHGVLFVTRYDGWPNPPPPDWQSNRFGFRPLQRTTGGPVPGGAAGTQYQWFGEGVIGSASINVFFSLEHRYVDLRPAGLPRNAGSSSVIRVPTTELSLPYWLLTIISAALPFWALVESVKAWQRRRRPNLEHACPACGYDLRTTPGRCPECGAAAGGDKMAG